MRKQAVQLEEGFKVGLRTTKYAIANGQAMHQMLGLTASEDGAVFPTYADIPAALRANLVTEGVVFAVAQWPFPQFYMGKRYLICAANTTTEGRFYYVDTTTWAVTQITPFKYLQNTAGNHPVFPLFREPFHFADYWTTWFATGNLITVFCTGAPLATGGYADSLAYASTFIPANPYLKIASLCGHRGSLYLGGLTPNAAWINAIAADRRNTSNITIPNMTRDKVWKSMTGGGNTLSMIVPALGYATQRVVDQTFLVGGSWTTTGGSWLFGSLAARSIVQQTLATVVADRLYKVSIEVLFGSSAATIQASLGTAVGNLHEAVHYGTAAMVRPGEYIKAQSNVLRIVATGTGTCYRVSVTEAFSLDDDNMRLDTDMVAIPTGDVYQLLPIAKHVVASCMNGVCALHHYPDRSVSALGCDILTHTGGATRHSGAAGIGGAIVVSNVDTITRISNDLQVKEDSLSWHAGFIACNTAVVVATYDPINDEYRVSNSTITFVVTDTGVSQVYNPVTSIFAVAGSTYQMYYAATPDPSGTFEIVTDMLDFGNQVNATIIGVEVVAHDVTGLSISVQAYMNGAFITTANVTINPDNFAAFSVTTNKARIRVVGTSTTSGAPKVAAIKVHYIGGDERLG